MKRLACAVGVLALFAPLCVGGEMKAQLKIDGSKPKTLRTKLNVYGNYPRSCIVEPDGLRLWFPDKVADIKQNGFYSLFALAGDCEIVFTYELLSLPAPKNGYGSGIGLAFDLESKGGMASIQRVTRPSEGDGYALHVDVGGNKGTKKEQDRFVPTTARWGQIGLRRVKKELIFLVADEEEKPLREVDRWPFSDQTIRAVRFFADSGGSPTGVDVRLTEIQVRAEEMTGGTPQREQPRTWWPWVVVPGVAVLAFTVWRARRRRAEE